MQKIMLACFVMVALVSCSVAAPAYHAGPAYGSAPVHISAPVQIAAPAHTASYGSQNYLFPVAIQGGYGANVPAAPPSILVGAASHPSASSSAAARHSGLNAGHYKQLAVPSYLLLASEVVNPAYGHANIASHGSAAY